MKYRKKPIEVEAFRLGYDPVPVWFTSLLVPLGGSFYTRVCNKDFNVIAFNGDWLVRGFDGQIYNLSNDNFIATYEAIAFSDISNAEEEQS